MKGALGETLKYFFLTFLSFTIMLFIAKGSVNFILVLCISLPFGVVFAMDRYNVWDKIIVRNKATDKQNTL